MKSTRFLTYAMAVGALFVAGSAQAITLTVGDAYYVGSVQPATPANISAEIGFINELIDCLPGTGPGTCTGSGSETLVRSALDTSLFPDAVAGAKQDNSNTTIDITGQDYVAGKYGQTLHVWYIGGISDTSATLPATASDRNGTSGLSHSSAFCASDDCDPPDFDVPEPGSLALLGLGMIGLAYKRRRRIVR